MEFAVIQDKRNEYSIEAPNTAAGVSNRRLHGFNDVWELKELVERDDVQWASI